MPSPWSLDARVLLRPARAFRSSASASDSAVRSSLWAGVRRPLFLTFVLACGVSLIATSVASVRLIATATLYWSFVAICEVVALSVVAWRSRRPRGFAYLVDTFFAGHAAWTLFLLLFGGLLAFSPPADWWYIIVGPGIVGIVVVVAWSAYVDVCFFRHVCGATLGRAILDAAFCRLITWTLVMWIFAVPSSTPFGVFHGLVREIAEVIK